MMAIPPHISVLISLILPSLSVFPIGFLQFQIDQTWASNLTSPGLNRAKLIYSEFSAVLSLLFSFLFMIIFLGRAAIQVSLFIRLSILWKLEPIKTTCLKR